MKYYTTNTTNMTNTTNTQSQVPQKCVTDVTFVFLGDSRAERADAEQRERARAGCAYLEGSGNTHSQNACLDLLSRSLV